MQGLIFFCALSWRGEKNLLSMPHSWSTLDPWVLTEVTEFWMHQQEESPDGLSVTHIKKKKLNFFLKPTHKQKSPKLTASFKFSLSM